MYQLLRVGFNQGGGPTAGVVGSMLNVDNMDVDVNQVAVIL